MVPPWICWFCGGSNKMKVRSRAKSYWAISKSYMPSSTTTTTTSSKYDTVFSAETSITGTIPLAGPVSTVTTVATSLTVISMLNRLPLLLRWQPSSALPTPSNRLQPFLQLSPLPTPRSWPDRRPPLLVQHPSSEKRWLQRRWLLPPQNVRKRLAAVMGQFPWDLRGPWVSPGLHQLHLKKQSILFFARLPKQRRKSTQIAPPIQLLCPFKGTVYKCWGLCKWIEMFF